MSDFEIVLAIWIGIGLIVAYAVRLSLKRTNSKNVELSTILTLLFWPLFVAIAIGGVGRKRSLARKTAAEPAEEEDAAE